MQTFSSVRKIFWVKNIICICNSVSTIYVLSAYLSTQQKGKNLYTVQKADSSCLFRHRGPRGRYYREFLLHVFFHILCLQWGLPTASCSSWSHQTWCHSAWTPQVPWELAPQLHVLYHFPFHLVPWEAKKDWFGVWVKPFQEGKGFYLQPKHREQLFRAKCTSE